MKKTTTALLLLIFCLSACYMYMPQTDMMLINKTKDSLYYTVNAYGEVEDSIDNMAYERVTDVPTNKTTYIITGYTIAPGDTTNPTKSMKGNWKHFATEHNGVTILLYKRNIEKLPHGNTLTRKDIFRRLDFTAKQLDSLKYKIVLK